jgi:hypothetical protein
LHLLFFLSNIQLNNYINDINDNTSNVAIDVTITDSDIFIKDNIINIDIDACHILDDFGYNFYLIRK